MFTSQICFEKKSDIFAFYTYILPDKRSSNENWNMTIVQGDFSGKKYHG